MCGSDELRSIVAGLADLEDINSATSKVLARIAALDAKISAPPDHSELRTVAHLVFVAWDTGAWHMARSSNPREREAVTVMCYAMRRLAGVLGIPRPSPRQQPGSVSVEVSPGGFVRCPNCGEEFKSEPGVVHYCPPEHPKIIPVPEWVNPFKS